MGTVTSRDGTHIAFEQSGVGSAVILVVGAFNDRTTGTPLARFLESQFTVVTYDRRGRRASSDTTPYAIEREVDDLDALIAHVGGAACVFGYSSGAILALRAAADRRAIARLALYDPRPTGTTTGALAPQLSALIAAGRRGDAVELFQREAVSIPTEIIAQLRHAPFRPVLEQVAHTLVYESTILRAVPASVIDSIRVPTLVIDGERSPTVVQQAAQSLADALPISYYHTLPGQGHDLVPDAIGSVVQKFFLAQNTGPAF